MAYKKTAVGNQKSLEARVMTESLARFRSSRGEVGHEQSRPSPATIYLANLKAESCK